MVLFRKIDGKYVRLERPFTVWPGIDRFDLDVELSVYYWDLPEAAG